MEIILVDDGSTDETGSILDAYEQVSTIRVVRGPNRGAAEARNTGTELATGEYIQYLDADDMLLPDAIASRVRALVTSDGDVAYSDWQKLVQSDGGSFKSGETICRKIEDVHSDAQNALFTEFWSPPAALLWLRRQ